MSDRTSERWPHAKQRGWRRRIRALDRWAAAEAARVPDPAGHGGYDSAEVWFDWPQPVPTLAARAVVRSLVRIHDAWSAWLPPSGDAYLGLWIFHPGLMESQVVAAVGDRARDYAARHAEANRSAPPALYHLHPHDLQRFEWTRHRRDEYGVPVESWLARLAEPGS